MTGQDFADLMQKNCNDAAEREMKIAALTAENGRLRAIESAAKTWRASLEEDGWTKEDIESGICRSGIAELMRLIDQQTAVNSEG